MSLWRKWGIGLLVLVLLATGCQKSQEEHHQDALPTLQAARLGQGQKLQVVATTSIVGDVARQVGGEWIDLTVLLPLGTDPHAFDPTPQDAAAIARAHVVLINGAGLETFMDRLIQSAGDKTPVVPLSASIELLMTEAEHADEHEGDEHENEEEHHHEGGDPHVWFDPNLVMVWVNNVEQVFSALDPQHASAYQANAAAYREKLKELDGWIREQVALLPQAHRKLVTDHELFGYFAQRYGFEQVGAVIPGYSTLAAPSAQELAELETRIRELGARAVLVGQTVNPELARRVADDTGTRLVFVYHGSLSEPGGPAGDYVSLMRYNVSAIVDALK